MLPEDETAAVVPKEDGEESSLRIATEDG